MCQIFCWFLHALSKRFLSCDLQFIWFMMIMYYEYLMVISIYLLYEYTNAHNALSHLLNIILSLNSRCGWNSQTLASLHLIGWSLSCLRWALFNQLGRMVLFSVRERINTCWLLVTYNSFRHPYLKSQLYCLFELQK